MGKFVITTTTDDIKKMYISSLMVSLMIAVVGIVLYVLTDIPDRMIGMSVGLASVVTSFVVAYKYFKRDGARLYKYNLIFGILFLILGIIVMLDVIKVSSFITICLGLYLILLGGLKLSYGIWFKVGNDSSWFITCVIGIMLLIFGIMLIINPFESLTLSQTVGLFLLIASVLDMTDTFMLLKRADKVLEIFW